MDAAARLRGFNLLEKKTVWTDISPLCHLTDKAESTKLYIAAFISTKGSSGNLKDPNSLSKHVDKNSC